MPSLTNRRVSSERMKKKWQDPVWRAHRLKVFKKTVSDPQWRKRQSELATKRHADPSFKKKILKILTSKEYRDKISKSVKASWNGPSGDKRRIDRQAKAFDNKIIVRCSACDKALVRKHKSKSGLCFCSSKCAQKCGHILSSSKNTQESYLEKLLKPFGFIYFGDKKRGKIGAKFPDFVHAKKKVIVELFGERWHEEGSDKDRVKYFKKLGYKCCVIWSKELRNVDSNLERVLSLL